MNRVSGVGRLDSGGRSYYCIIHCISASLAKEDQGFAVLFGILLDTCVDGVFLFVLVANHVIL